MSRILLGEKYYVLKPQRGGDADAEERVEGPFESHREGWMARCGWAYDQNDIADRAELLTGHQLAEEYKGRHGKVGVPGHAEGEKGSTAAEGRKSAPASPDEKTIRSWAVAAPTRILWALCKAWVHADLLPQNAGQYRVGCLRPAIDDAVAEAVAQGQLKEGSW